MASLSNSARRTTAIVDQFTGKRLAAVEEKAMTRAEQRSAEADQVLPSVGEWTCSDFRDVNNGDACAYSRESR